MAETTNPVSAPAVEPYVRFTPEQVARNKKAHDERRKAIRAQNSRSKSLK